MRIYTQKIGSLEMVFTCLLALEQLRGFLVSHSKLGTAVQCTLSLWFVASWLAHPGAYREGCVGIRVSLRCVLCFVDDLL